MNRIGFASAGALLCAAVILTLPAPTAAQGPAPTEYDFVYVDAFQADYDLRESYLFDINDLGQGCGHATDLPSYSGYSWRMASDKTRLPFTLARGINLAGKVAGLNKVYDTVGGGLTTIPQVPGAVAPPVALDINDHDVVVGYAETCICSNSDHILQIPFIWDPVNGSRSIAVTGAKELVKVNNHEVAVGIIRGGSPDGFVYEIATGRTLRLSTYLPTNPYPWTEAADINDLGVVTGIHRSNDAQSYHGFVWTEAGGATLLPHFGGNVLLDVRPAALNDAGVVVGRAEVADFVWHAFTWDAAHGMRDLNALATPPAGFILDRALGINERGWIVGDGHFGPNWSSSQAFVLIPRGDAALAVTPGPSALRLRLSPNPTAGTTTIEYALAAPGAARIGVYDLGGRRVAELDQPMREAGVHSARWDGRDRAGRPVPSGAYVVRLEAPGGSTTRMLAVVR